LAGPSQRCDMASPPQEFHRDLASHPPAGPVAHEANLIEGFMGWSQRHDGTKWG
jgi:hypothetical protein